MFALVVPTGTIDDMRDIDSGAYKTSLVVGSPKADTSWNPFGRALDVSGHQMCIESSYSSCLTAGLRAKL